MKSCSHKVQPVQRDADNELSFRADVKAGSTRVGLQKFERAQPVDAHVALRDRAAEDFGVLLLGEAAMLQNTLQTERIFGLSWEIRGS